ncbi:MULTISPECIES: bifunctional acetate--CoA ligase family protein/GNAT family N-acetyltransferase [Pandoraea]|uniref:GCN5 family acetyltransferase n=1 Tax=Pandoraea pnomenusa TaxID=93220 RepID=A0ABY6WF87_9BURK|nr:MULTISPECIES: bifunctional acetate--CoA ligase family protein/GNAT family N-acetyltransferase [Pandoraea]AHB05783.1 GCN5 family acetyltransferase [Pandoraea pnomenusa 3kgm]AHB78148.1 GNAT family N-acetyltransferase [Pandoraea pnomenusa]AHN73556.1 GCN5 family acetyltransferase [Pandoraea pnomenusa]ANC46806.1 GCN5 family acetyltransferase [Pandoraea pnomenusa]MBN9093753.1 bifunctional acetate--CoA ligase family protein/GNAT family N-acetyltransferase [Pandoraea pnomenusa]
MTTRNLSQMFQPKSVAVIGASQRERRVGTTVLQNVIDGGFTGEIYPVNPKYSSLADRKCYRDVSDLPQAPDLAIVCTPPETVPGLIRDLGERGTRAVVVLTSGLARERDRHGVTLQERMLQHAKPHVLRILGPNCIGLLSPGIGLNASFAHMGARPGKLAFVSQSGALTTAVLDWADAREIGFSHFVSLGDSADVDFGDMLDYLASDPGTDAILMYMESIRDARKFMSAARAAARNKPVVVIKSGRVPEGAQAAASHTGAMAGADDVYDAAIRRAGMLRVDTTDELFAAVETLARLRPFWGDKLSIMTNGGGAGVMATDALVLDGGKLARLSDKTRAALDAALPTTLGRVNPVDIGGDADLARYTGTLAALCEDPETAAVLFIQAPTAVMPSLDVANALAALPKPSKNIFTCWLGGETAERARRICREAGLPTYDTPENAARAFLEAVNYRRNQSLLMETPPSIPPGFAPDVARVRAIIDGVMREGRALLSEPEAKGVLAAYGIPVVETLVAETPEQAGALAQGLGFPVAVKLVSPDITHKSDVGGVVLNIETAEQACDAARQIRKRALAAKPDARVTGYSVQRMANGAEAFELIVGVATDNVFGPVLLFGQGGTAVEVIADRTIGLPPLNLNLARDMVARARVSKLLAGYRNRPPADHEAIYLTLVKLSQLVCDVPEIAELDINPLFADAHGVLALDARIVARKPASAGHGRLAIRPYPQELESTVDAGGKPVRVRPIRPEDEPAYNAFFHTLTPQDVQFRYFGLIKELSHSQMARVTQIDYDRAMTFVATERDEQGNTRLLGVVQALADPDNTVAEFAVTVSPAAQGRGLGRALMEHIVDYSRRRGTGELIGYVLTANTRMLTLARHLGFVEDKEMEAGVLHIRLPLQQTAQAQETRKA